MKWLCHAAVEAPHCVLFIACTAPGAALFDADGSITIEEVPSGGVEPPRRRSGAQELLTTAASFLAPIDEERTTPSRGRPTTADIRRRAAAAAKRSRRSAGPSETPAAASLEAAAEEVTVVCDSPAVQPAPTEPGDSLALMLLDTSPGEGVVRLYAASMPVASLVPAGMAAGTYCELLDHLLRPQPETPSSGARGVLRVAVSGGGSPGAPASRRVELRVLLGAQAKGSFVLAVVDVAAAAPEGHRAQLDSLLRLLGTEVAAAAALRWTVARQAAELAALRAAVSGAAVAKKTDAADGLLCPMLDILNAKKEKIRQLSAQLQAAAAPSSAREVVKTEPGDDNDGGRGTSRSTQRGPSPLRSPSGSTEDEGSDSDTDTNDGGSAPGRDKDGKATEPGHPARGDLGSRAKRARSEGGAWASELFGL